LGAGGLVGGVVGCSGDDDAASPGPTTASTTTAPPVTAKPLADQTSPKGANGLTFDRDGTLWVADGTGSQIVGVDPASGAILHRYGRAFGVTGPDDLAFDADGRLWWTSVGAGTVGRITDPGAPDAANKVVAQLGPGMNPVTVSPDGRVFAARLLMQDDHDDELYELDPHDRKPPRRVLDRAGNLNGFAVGPDGRIYAPRVGIQKDGTVVAIDPDSGKVDELAGGMTGNVSVKLDAGGTIYVLTVLPGTVSTVDPRSGKVTAFAKLPGDIADNMAFDSHGDLYVSAFNQPTVWRVDPEGKVTATLTLGRR
jgi:sugar lactone lactonase YvrE